MIRKNKKRNNLLIMEDTKEMEWGKMIDKAIHYSVNYSDNYLDNVNKND